MLQRYGSCSSYEDSGTSITTFTPPDGGTARTLRVTFETAFDRVREAFRFEYEATGLRAAKRGIVWRSTGDLARSWWSQSAQSAEGELSALLLSVHAGTSGGTSQMIPGLLLGRPLPWTLGEPIARENELEIPIVGRTMTLFCEKDENGHLHITRWTAQHRRMRMGTLIDHEDDHEPSEETKSLLAATITQEVKLRARFDTEIPASRFARISGP